ncbi:MAG: periplasmic heavy metal sensor [Pseudohongiellaceae bacterium]|jgi:uncharacterized membrane protein
MTQLNRRRGLIVALLISIAINLFLVGGVAYRFYLINSEASIGRPLPPNISWLIRDLTPERQEELRAGLRERGMQGRAARIRLFEAQSESNRVMTQDPFDEEALVAALAELRDAANDYQRLSHLQAVETLSQLSAKERRNAVEFINRRGPRDGRPPALNNNSRRPSGPPHVNDSDRRGPPFEATVGSPPSIQERQ